MVVCSIVPAVPIHTFVSSAVLCAHSIKMNITRGHPAAVEAYNIIMPMRVATVISRFNCERII